jgi:hypothetical protein
MQEIELEHEISKILLVDLNNSGKKQITCFLANGEVIGYHYVDEQTKPTQAIAKDAKILPEELLKYEKLQKEKEKFVQEIENLTIKITNRMKDNKSYEMSLPSTTSVKIDLQSNNENVKFYKLTFRNARI